MTIFIDTIVCDDIRTEDNGKLLAIGVYTNEILLRDFTVPMFLSMWIRFFGMSPGTHKNTLVVSFNGKEMHRLGGTIENTEGYLPQGFIKGLPMQFEGPGELEFAIEFENGETVGAGKLRVNPFPLEQA